MKNTLTRLLVCLLMAAMLIPCAAIAEIDTTFEVPGLDEIFTPATDVATVEWTDESGMIKFNIPADWTEFDGEMIAQMVKDMLDQGLLDEAGANEYTKELMAQVESVYAFFYAADFVGNMNIGIAATDGQNMVAAFDVLKTTFESQYTQMGATVNSFELGSYGGRDAIVCKISYLGVEQTQVMIQPSDCTAMLTFTFAASAQDYVDLVMNSVVLAE